MAIDLGKQYGPLPLGAWIVVVGVGLGIAYYTRNAGTDEPVEVEDGSSPSGVGDGSVGGWVPTSPSGGNDVAAVDLSTNDAWGRAAINFLVAEGYNPTTSDQAIRKYLAGSSLSVSETALVARALMKYGAPPSPLPPVEEQPTSPPPPPPPPPPPSGTGEKKDVKNPPVLKVGKVTRTAITLYWNTVPGAQWYTIRFGNNLTRSTPGPLTQWVMTGLKPNTSYTFAVEPYKVRLDGSRFGFGQSNHVTVRTAK